jgi:hypothetical protein
VTRLCQSGQVDARADAHPVQHVDHVLRRHVARRAWLCVLVWVSRLID